MKKTLRKALLPAVAAGSLVISSLAVADFDETPEQEFRQSAMTIYSFYLKSMGAMVKGEVPFDAGAFATRAKELATATSLDVLADFPEGSAGDTDAKEKIWENWADFEAKFQALQKESAELAKVAAGGDQEAIKAQFGKTGKACHDDYRER